MRIWKILVLINLLVLGSPSIVSATSAGPKATLSAVTSLSTLARGERSLSLTVEGANVDSCSVSASPAIPNFPRSVNNCNGVHALAITLPVNSSLVDAKFSLTVSAVAAHSPKAKTLKIVQHPEYRVQLYGDSIAQQFAPEFTSDLEATGAIQVQTATFPGASLCDAIPLATLDAKSFKPDLVVIEYVGTGFTACTKTAVNGAYGSSKFLKNYEANAVTIAKIFKAAKTAAVLFDAGPTPPASNPGAVQPQSMQLHNGIIAAYDAAVAKLGSLARRIDPGVAVEGSGGAFVTKLPCLAAELAGDKCTGGSSNGLQENLVRSTGDDLFHLCPTPFADTLWWVQGCPTYASGAVRYAAAATAPIITNWGLSPVPVFLP